MSAFDAMIARSNDEFLDASTYVKDTFFDVKHYYVFCAHIIDAMCTRSTEETPKNRAGFEAYTRMFDEDVRMYAFRLAELWLSRIARAFENDRPLSDMESDIARDMAACRGCSYSYCAHCVISKRDAVCVAGVAIIAALKMTYDRDDPSFAELDVIHSHYKLVVGGKRTRRMSQFFCAVFMTPTVRSILNVGDSPCDKRGDGVADMLHDDVVRMEWRLCARLEWRLHMLNMPQFIQHFVDDIYGILCGMSKHRRRLFVRAVEYTRKRALQLALLLKMNASAGFAGNVIQCWTNALCVVIVSIPEIVEHDVYHSPHIRSALKRKYAKHDPDKGFVIEQCKTIREHVDISTKRYTVRFRGSSLPSRKRQISEV